MMTGWLWAAMPLMMLLMLALLAIFVWAIVWVTMHWMNKVNTPTMRSMPPEDFHQRYEQGYQPPEPWSETYQEGGKPYLYPQPQQEQPQAQYPQEQEMPRQN